MGDVGSLTNVPYISLLERELGDHAVSVIFNSGSGDLSGSSFGTITDPVALSVPTTIRIDYDDNLDPSFEIIVLGDSPSAIEIGQVIVAAVDGHGSLSAQVSSSVTGPPAIETVLITTDDPGSFLDIPVVTITQAGTGTHLSIV